jgi:hypothetical protein
MTTVRDIVERAYRKIGVVSADEAMQADAAASGLDAFNEMLSAWALHGITLSPAFTDAALADAFPLADKFREGTIYLLASRLSPEWMAPVAFDADDFFRRVQAAYMVIEESTIDRGLTVMPSQITTVYWSS